MAHVTRRLGGARRLMQLQAPMRITANSLCAPQRAAAPALLGAKLSTKFSIAKAGDYILVTKSIGQTQRRFLATSIPRHSAAGQTKAAIEDGPAKEFSV